MRERYKGLVLQWAESTDPIKNVFEVRESYEDGEAWSLTRTTGYSNRDFSYPLVEGYLQKQGRRERALSTSWWLC